MNRLSKKVILFDGVCNLCNSAVNFIIDKDHKDQFVFAPLQSKTGQQLLAQYHLPIDFMNNLILIDEGKLYQKSTAALKIAKALKFPWPVFYVFVIVPLVIRDFFYKILAKYRYKLFGKSAACRYPSDDIKAKFLVD